MARPECWVQIDLGSGPRWVRLSPVPADDEDVLDVDSGLGRALLGARVGERVRFSSPRGVALAAVRAVRPAFAVPARAS